MQPTQLKIRQIGNLQGVVIPKPFLSQLGLTPGTGMEMRVEGDALVLRKPATDARVGWADAARELAESGDDALLLGEFSNTEDASLDW